MLRASAGQTTFNAASFTPNKYLTLANPTWLNGLTKLTLAGVVQVNQAYDNATLWIVSQATFGDSQMCFALARTTAGKLRFYVFATLSDGNGVTVTSSLDVTGGAGGAPPVHVAVVYDGTQANADRVKLYINGVLDPSPTVSGTLRTSLLSATSPLNFGNADGTYFRGNMWGWAAWAGTALTAAQVLAAANLAANGQPRYYAYAALPATVPAPTHYWQLSESSDGSTNVTRNDSVGSSHLTSSGNVPSFGYAQWADQSGNDNLGTSAAFTSNAANATADTNTCVAPTLSAALRNGLDGWQFVDPAVPSNFIFGKFGLTTNPANWTVFDVVWVDDADLELIWHGAEQAGGDGNDNASPNAWGFIDTDDFSVSRSFTTAFGDGTTPAAGHTATNTLTAGAWLRVALRYTAGDALPRLWVNGTELPLTNIAGNPTYPVFGVIDHCGGTMNNWRLGQAGDIDETEFATNFKGKFLFHAVCLSSVSDADLARMDAWLVANGMA